VISIRRALPEEAERLTAIALSAKRQWGYSEREMEIWTPALTIKPEFISANEVWAAERDGEITGFHALIFSKRRANLEHLWILPPYMRQGIGRALFEHAAGLCRERGYQVMEIVSDPNAQGFYERMGARKTGLSLGEVDGQLRSLPILEMKL